MRQEKAEGTNMSINKELYLEKEILYNLAIQFIAEKNIVNAKYCIEKLLQVDNQNLRAKKLYTLLQPSISEKRVAADPSGMSFLNLGCGRRFHPSWINVDFVSTNPKVLAYDLKKDIPFQDASFDVVYHSHLLEHLPRSYAPKFIQECFRVLKPGGIIRVVVPDLETIVKLYLKYLTKALKGDKKSERRYEWIVLEMFDQMVRNVSGGEMLEYLKQDPIPEEDFVYKRVGSEVKDIIESIQEQRCCSKDSGQNKNVTQKFDALSVGKFRLSGEVHLWMYDRYSLGKLLRETGFEEIKVCQADESRIPNFNSYFLDIEPDGSVRKPDSLFMEAVKPTNLSLTHSKTRYSAFKFRPKIAHLCMQDYGGAGTAALRLHDGLLQLGINSVFLAHNIKRWKENTYLISAPAPYFCLKPGQTYISSMWDIYTKYNYHLLSLYPQRQPGLEAFSDTWAPVRLPEMPELCDADIIHFHWIAGTVNIPENLDFLKTKKIVWTLHDMNAFTGGCHYSAECHKFEEVCGSCPQLGSTHNNDLSRQIWELKRKAYQELDITIVTPSNWLADCVQKSTLLSKCPVHVIPNGLPTNIYKPYPKNLIRRSLGIDKNVFIILFGADAITNKRKGFTYLLNALKKISISTKINDIALAVFGNSSDIMLDKLGFQVINLDYISDEEQLAMIYSMADVTVIPSLQENFPNIVLESFSCGTPVVGFDVGGISDMIDHKINGYLAPACDTNALAEGILWIKKVNNNNIRLKCRETVLVKYNLQLQAETYFALYQDILKQ
jgi:glycosyltransferase involved in cell wall biosynthesis/predicted SAM-dependent methyltransferase